MKPFIHALLLGGALSACSKSDSPAPPEPESKSIVYICGSAKEPGGTDRAVVWKDASMTQVSTVPSPAFSYVSDIFVKSNDVYTSGIYEKEGKRYSAYWKNGEVVNLTSGNEYQSEATAIFVEGNDVYVAGYFRPSSSDFDKIGYWKNGTFTELGTGHVIDIFVVKGIVYVTGDEQGKVAFWKNGVVNHLTDGLAQGFATAIFVKDNDVYVSGYVYGTGGFKVAKYWKNGIVANLSDGTSHAMATDIAMVGNDLYVAGHTTNAAGKGIVQYWKNGVGTNLTDGSQNDYASKMIVQGKDVYVAFTSLGAGGASTAKYSKNGKSVVLSDLNSFAQAIAVITE